MNDNNQNTIFHNSELDKAIERWKSSMEKQSKSEEFIIESSIDHIIPNEYQEYEWYESIFNNTTPYFGKPMKQPGVRGHSEYAKKSAELLRNSDQGIFCKIVFE